MNITRCKKRGRWESRHAGEKWRRAEIIFSPRLLSSPLESSRGSLLSHLVRSICVRRHTESQALTNMPRFGIAHVKNKLWPSSRSHYLFKTPTAAYHKRGPARSLFMSDLYCHRRLTSFPSEISSLPLLSGSPVSLILLAGTSCYWLAACGRSF